MPAYKLYYFPLRARGELPRLVFAAAGVEYEDIRITFEEWPKRKQEMPFGQMPVLEVDGKKLAQSYAIGRYLAREFGLEGKNKWEVAQTDMYSGVVEDLLMAVVKINFEKDEKVKAELLKKFLEEGGPNFLKPVEKSLSSGPGYLVGGSLTYADLAFFNLLEFVDAVLKEDGKKLLSPLTNIQKFRERIAGLPKIAAWRSKRPESAV